MNRSRYNGLLAAGALMAFAAAQAVPAQVIGDIRHDLAPAPASRHSRRDEDRLAKAKAKREARAKKRLRISR